MSAFNHVGQCVTDLDRSKRFYCELFGFIPSSARSTRPTTAPPSSCR